MKIKKKIISLQKHLEFSYLELLRKHLLKKLPQKKKIKVAFLGYALGSSCDIFSNLYKEFAKDDRFEPYMVIVPNSYGSTETMLELQNQAKSYLDKLEIPSILGYSENNHCFFDAASKLNPDIIFMTHHYDWVPQEFKINSFKKKLVYITPYSYFLDNNLKYNANTSAYFFAHKCFFETPELSILWQQAALNKKNICSDFLGYLKIDNLLTQSQKLQDHWKIKHKNIKRIIWAPHHLDAPLSNFLEYKDLFLNLAASNKNIQLAFRPHPGLKGSLVRVAGWTESEVDKYWNAWLNMPNTFISEGEFSDLFFTSDAMILDSISFIAEYLITKKPSLVNAPKNTDFSFNSFALKIKDHLYHSSSWEEVINFIDNVVCQENDPLKNDRIQFLKESFLPPNGKSAAHNIYTFVCHEIFKEALR